MTVAIGELAGNHLGYTSGNRIEIDQNAAGYDAQYRTELASDVDRLDFPQSRLSLLHHQDLDGFVLQSPSTEVRTNQIDRVFSSDNIASLFGFVEVARCATTTFPR